MIELEKVLQPRRGVLEYLAKDIVRNSMDMHSLLFEREHFELYVALKEGEIRGHLSKFHAPEASYINISGDDDFALSKLFDLLPSEGAVIFSHPSISTKVRERAKPTAEFRNNLMVLKRGEERRIMVSQNPAKRLSTDYAEEYALFPNWRPIPVGWARERLQRDRIFGVILDGKLVSVASVATKIPETGLIMGVETLEAFRGRGYATLAVSAAVQDALSQSETASLGVRSDNFAAIHIYEKLGFSKIGEEAWLDLGTGLVP